MPGMAIALGLIGTASGLAAQQATPEQPGAIAVARPVAIHLEVEFTAS